MILVVAGWYDTPARRYAVERRAHGVRLVTPADLSRRQWSLDLPPGRSIVALDDGPPEQPSAVLVRLDYIRDSDLPHLAQPDRGYAAAEMTAFLTAWLYALTVPVVNPPSTVCLSGPGWAWEQWEHAAATMGIPVQPASASNNGDPPATPAIGQLVTVAGDRIVGASDPYTALLARRLARAAGLQLISLTFTTDGIPPRLVAATPWPNLTDPDIAEAVDDLLRVERS